MSVEGQSSGDRFQWVKSEAECQQSSQPGCEKKWKDCVGVEWVRCQWAEEMFGEFSVSGELNVWKMSS